MQADIFQIDTWTSQPVNRHLFQQQESHSLMAQAVQVDVSGANHQAMDPTGSMPPAFIPCLFQIDLLLQRLSIVYEQVPFRQKLAHLSRSNRHLEPPQGYEPHRPHAYCGSSLVSFLFPDRPQATATLSCPSRYLSGRNLDIPASQTDTCSSSRSPSP